MSVCVAVHYHIVLVNIILIVLWLVSMMDICPTGCLLCEIYCYVIYCTFRLLDGKIKVLM